MGRNSGGGGRGSSGPKSITGIENNNVNIRGYGYRASLGPDMNGRRYVFVSPKTGSLRGRRYDIGYLSGGDFFSNAEQAVRGVSNQELANAIFGL